jgi:hypothetical protein
MAAACLREDRWLVDHLAADLPVADVTRFALEAGADLVVLSAATQDRAAAAAAAGAGDRGGRSPAARAGRPSRRQPARADPARPGRAPVTP